MRSARTGHPPYSPHLAPRDFHCFSNTEGSRHFTSNEVKDAVKHWLYGLEVEVYDEGIQKLVTGNGKCLNAGGDYVEKQLGVCTNDTLNFVFIFGSFIFLYSRRIFNFLMTLMYKYTVEPRSIIPTMIVFPHIPFAIFGAE